jgi:hypothetical protein
LFLTGGVFELGGDLGKWTLATVGGTAIADGEEEKVNKFY